MENEGEESTLYKIVNYSGKKKKKPAGDRVLHKMSFSLPVCEMNVMDVRQGEQVFTVTSFW